MQLKGENLKFKQPWQCHECKSFAGSLKSNLGGGLPKFRQPVPGTRNGQEVLGGGFHFLAIQSLLDSS